ncbi:hypothetical protein ABT246_20170 [Streptomyces sp. NPDC001553]|uniref:hypothetical protein n=1 Tax=Streptomyces sp. NPDC001553 TaxID=3154385 RepID=UPI00332BDBA5
MPRLPRSSSAAEAAGEAGEAEPGAGGVAAGARVVPRVAGRVRRPAAGAGGALARSCRVRGGAGRTGVTWTPRFADRAGAGPDSRAGVGA